LQQLAEFGKIDFWIDWIDQGAIFGHRFVTDYRGRDRRKSTNPLEYLYFSEEKGNMVNPRLIQDSTDERNFCYTLWKGQGANRYTYPRSDAVASTRTNYARREFVFDASSSDDAAAAIDAGDVEVAEGRQKIELAFEMGANFIYRKDFELGDRGTACFGFEFDMRITGIVVSFDGQRESVQPTMVVESFL
jgi:hypothetical protein